MSADPQLVDYPANLSGVLDLGHCHYLLRGRGGAWWLWWHDCPERRPTPWMWIGAPDDGTPPSGHQIRSTDPLDVGGSLICPDCKDHGFIEGGRWRPA